jgi:predicted ATPase
MTNPRRKQLRFTQLGLANWRNFTQVDVTLDQRVFLVGPNASGKSNLLDVFRFLHDVAAVGGGFRAAVDKPWRGSVAKLKCLAGRHHADVGIRVSVGHDRTPRLWEYELHFAADAVGMPVIKKERIVKQGKELRCRPDEQDRKDKYRLTQTYLEQAAVNEDFRELAEMFASVRYLHLVPQVVRHLLYSAGTNDPFGGDFLRRLADLPEDERRARLGVVRNALRAAVPQLKELEFVLDPVEKRPHLQAEYEHFPGTWLQEDQFSDGTLRLIGLIWGLLEGEGPLLLEEPEVALHPEIIRYLPYLFFRVPGGVRRQVMVSTHSPDLLRNEGIGLHEVLLLQPGPDGTTVKPASDFEQVRVLVEGGMNLDEVIVPTTSPRQAQKMALLGG